MELTFLGTGGSFGTPVVGCDCPTCTSTDSRDQRTRHGALLTLKGGTLLIDTPPEIRLQLISAGVSRVDAVWFTHTHADHVHGIDDLRVFSARAKTTLPAFSSAAHKVELEARFPYIFGPSGFMVPGTLRPEIELTAFSSGKRLSLLGEEVLPLEVNHGPGKAYGFRIENLAYLTDVKDVPEETKADLKGLDVLVLSGIWWEREHPTQMTIDQALSLAGELSAKRTFITHLTHRVLHAEVESRLPPGVFAAYDGLVVQG